MKRKDFDTLSEAVNSLSKSGYIEDFKANEDKIVGTTSSNEYLPSELKIVGSYRFEGMSNPQDDTIVFAIEANDGNKGTLVMSYSAEHYQNVELIKEIPEEIE